MHAGCWQNSAVSIHAPTRGATHYLGFPEGYIEFQSTRPRGERLNQSSYPLYNRRFQSTLPRGERPSTASTRAASRTGFNPRSHEWSDTYSRLISHPWSLFQSTLPRGERPYQARQAKASEDVSIHAPTRGATGLWCGSSPGIKFQSTLPRGERQRNRSNFSSRLLFQSTLPRGERPI